MDLGHAASLVIGAMLAVGSGAATTLLAYELEKRRVRSERKRHRKEKRVEKLRDLLETVGRIATELQVMHRTKPQAEDPEKVGAWLDEQTQILASYGDEHRLQPAVAAIGLYIDDAQTIEILREIYRLLDQMLTLHKRWLGGEDVKREIDASAARITQNITALAVCMEKELDKT
jgi:hypothetical protein